MNAVSGIGFERQAMFGLVFFRRLTFIEYATIRPSIVYRIRDNFVRILRASCNSMTSVAAAYCSIG